MSLLVIIVSLFSLLTSVLSAQVFTLNIQCTEDPDCKPNALCYKSVAGLSQGVCRCSDGYATFSNTTFYECATAKNLSEDCDYHFQCQDKAGEFAECNSHRVCQCLSNAHAGLNGTCYKTSKLTEACTSDQNCKLADGLFGICTYGHCDCNIGYRPSADKYHCLKSLELGDKCSSQSECELISNAECAPTGKCACKRGHVISQDGRTCLESANDFGGSCMEDLQCYENLLDSFCLNGQCSCQEDHHPYDKECMRTAKSGQSCSESENCIWDKKLDGNVECSETENTEKQCKCIYGESADFYGCKLSPGSGNLIKPELCFTVVVLIRSLIN